MPLPSTIPLLPQISKEEYEAARQELRSIDARPIKKARAGWRACSANTLPTAALLLLLLLIWRHASCLTTHPPTHPPCTHTQQVAEAKARKQKRLGMRLDAARQKAEAVSNQEDVPLKQKMREIEKIYNQARAGKGAKKKGGGSRSEKYKAQKKGPRLDARMRKDRRGTEAAAKRNKGKGGKAGGPGGKGGGAGGVKAGRAGKNRRR